MIVKDLRCNGCNEPLPIPKNSRGVVTCAFCKTESIIEGLKQTAEMAAKENINSGIPLTAPSAVLHKALVGAIADTKDMPLDIFSQGIVTREEHHCVPAFHFYFNAEASYTYQVGDERTQTVIRGSKNEQYEKEITRTEWTSMNGQANASGEATTSGNRDFRRHIEVFYTQLNAGDLIDYIDLGYPPDVISHEFNFPIASAFNDYVRPYVTKMLEADAKKLLATKNTRNYAMGNANINREEPARLWLGLYRIVLEYKGREYYVWVTGNGKKIINEGMPTDDAVSLEIEAKTSDRDSDVAAVPYPQANMWWAGTWGCVLLAVVLLLTTTPVIGLLPLLPAIGLGIKIWTIYAPYHAECTAIRDRYNAEIDELSTAAARTAAEFRHNKVPLRGVYEHEVAGDAHAF